MQALPLSGIRVFDLTWNFAGPVATRILAILGAEVLRMETAGHIEPMRGIYLGGPVYEANTSKKAFTLNMATEKGRELAFKLAMKSDVVAENFSRGVIQRFGLGYERLREAKPDIIMLTSSGYGRTGPDADHLAFGQTVQAYAGVTALIGYPGGPSRGFEGGGIWTDPLTGITAAYALLSALEYRRQTGKGELIDISMLEATLAPLAEPVMDWFLNGRDAVSVGNEDLIMAPHNNYRCQGEDKWVAIAVGNEAQWRGLCRAMGDPAWTREAKFADQYQRWLHRLEIDERLRAWVKEYAAEEITTKLQAEGVPAGPAYDTREAYESAHLRERGFYVPVEHPQLGTKVAMRPPWRLFANGEEIIGQYAHAPDVGQDNDYVYGTVLGLSEEEIAALYEEGAIT